ncbi:MAG TPA: DctP family TRAP transporter solute-binding subunit [Arenibaculum sp.]|nr:DctP family TRAP transporter solute-binding subunit [Arenibaculum sp.]
MTRQLPIRVVALTATALGVMAFSTSVQAEDWRFAIEEIQGSVQDAYAQKFKELIEEKSGGEVTVTVYPYGALGTSAQLTDLVADGALQFANASPGHLGTLVPEIQVFSIPYLLSSDNEVNKKVLSESEVIYEDLGGALANRGLKLLTMYPEGEMVWTANREIRSPEDFDNFKMRTMVSPMLLEAYKAFGADPTPMPYSEVYGGLQLNMIDGQVNPIFAIEEMKFYEVSDYMIFSGEQQFTTTVVSNQDWFASLPEDRQQMVEETIDELTDYIFQVQEEYNAERLEAIKEDRPELEIIELTEDERAAFRERAQQVRERYVEMVGGDAEQVLNGLEQEFQEAREEVAQE